MQAPNTKAADERRAAVAAPADALPGNRVERPWGWFATVDESPGFKVKRIHVFAGRQISLQRHRHRAEHWVVVVGTARVTVADRVTDLFVGQHVDIALGQVHRLANVTALPLEIIEVQWGDYLGDDDIVRLQDDYGRTSP